jgi:GNAT superfamily N-acetyltransferase
MIVRPAGPADLAEIALVSEANDEPVGDPDGPGSRYLDHLLRHGRLLVAEWDGTIVGFAGAIQLPMGRFLTDLFVDPASHSRGVGGALLGEILPEDGPRLTFSSSDPRALPLYVRAGLAPWWPLLYLAAPAGPAHLERSGAADRLTVEPLDRAAAVELELALTGHDRSRDWALWTAVPGQRAFGVRDGRRRVAVGFTAPPRLGRLVLAPEGDPVAIVLAALADAPGGALTGLAIPGPNPATRALLERGWRIEARDVHMASGPDLLDPTRLLPDESLA